MGWRVCVVALMKYSRGGPSPSMPSSTNLRYCPWKSSASKAARSARATAPSTASMAAAGFTGLMVPRLSSSVRSSVQSPSMSPGSATRYFSTR